jgi:hypothetical protein
MAGYVSIAKESVESFKVGQGSVGAAKAAITTANTPALKYVEIKADLTNTNNVFVGDLNVTTANGYFLDAGEMVRIPIDNLDKIWVIADAAAQGFSWLVV